MKHRDKLVRVCNPMQRGYSYYHDAMPGRSFDPRFTPALTPKEILQLGAFNGLYLNNAMREYPDSWLKSAKLSKVADPSINLFKVASGQSLEEWQRNGWINPQDPRGWFEWYCRYHQGRRTEDDDRQIKRWAAYARHSAQVRLNGAANPMKRVVQRQSLLHWAHDPFPDFTAYSFETVYQKIRRVMSYVKNADKIYKA